MHNVTRRTKLLFLLGYRSAAVGGEWFGGGLRGCSDARDVGRGRFATPTVPELKVRVINVVDIMSLRPPSEHSRRMLTATSTRWLPAGHLCFAGCPWLIHRLTYERSSRFHLVGDVVDRCRTSVRLRQAGIRDKLLEHKECPAQRRHAWHNYLVVERGAVASVVGSAEADNA
jgi:hypothetical protein